MLKNHLTLTLRTLWRNKLYTLLNIWGLAIGMSACLIIYLLTSFELSYDRFHPHKDRIYRVTTLYTGLSEGTNYGVHAPLAGAMADQVSGIESIASCHTQYRMEIKVAADRQKMKVFKAIKSVMLTEPAYFDMFQSYQWLAGSANSSLREPFQVVLTQKQAQTYFGSLSPNQMLGQLIHYNDSLTCRVSGIVKDLPGPTDLYFTDFISFPTISHSWLKEEISLQSWNSLNSSSLLFLKFAPNVEQTHIQKHLNRLADSYVNTNTEAGTKTHYRLQALADIHFGTEIGIFNGSRPAAHLPTLQLLMGISFLILLVAVINFINLVTAQAVRRAKEVGVRKVLGSTRKELIGGFLLETLLLTITAALCSWLLVYLSLPYVREFFPQEVVLNPFTLSTLWFMLVTILEVSLLAGLYPAFVLSSFVPVLALKNQIHAFSTRTRTAFLRKGLIVFQFAFAQVLIIGTFIAGSQMKYMLQKDLGFSKDAILYFNVPYTTKADHKQTLKTELLRIPSISAISIHSDPPATGGAATMTMSYEDGKEIRTENVHQKGADSAYLALYDIALVAGRNLLEQDSIGELLINETCAKKFGFKQPQEAIGKTLNKYHRVVGVVKDFHVQSLRNSIPPVAISYANRTLNCFSLKLATKGKGAAHFQATIQEVETLWKKFYPQEDFAYSFIDEYIERMYEAERRTAKLASIATGMAIFISCLGLVGLSTYMAEQRKKEIGIRKVLGASVWGITLLLSKEFCKLVSVAFIMATPIALYASKEWLQSFAYQVELHWGVFISAAILALLIALVTVSYQTIKAALANPVNSLRSE